MDLLARLRQRIEYPGTLAWADLGNGQPFAPGELVSAQPYPTVPPRRAKAVARAAIPQGDGGRGSGATVNLLHQENWYQPSHIPLSRSVAQMLLPALLFPRMTEEG